jgi:hypothetical protein
MTDVSPHTVLAEFASVLTALADSQANLLERIRSTHFNEVIIISTPARSNASGLNSGDAPVPPSAVANAVGPVAPSHLEPLPIAHHSPPAAAEMRLEAAVPTVAPPPVPGAPPVPDVAPREQEGTGTDCVESSATAPSARRDSPKALKRDYDYFKELDAQIAALIGPPSGGVETN